ncbi:MAG: F0F1 ATP synthase subunit delta [Gammaproteobacteria bacterium]|nr:F0F1 ATP synthase subunit delta [Gammaproteobacteria bacterium]
MAEITTIARPYAQAVFSLAQEQKDLTSWSETLQLFAAIASDADMQELIGNPGVDKERLAAVFIEIGGKKISDQASNLINVLVENGRMAELPEISSQYEELKAEAESTVQAEVTAAFEVSASQQKAIIAALKKRLGRDVTLTCKTDDSLLGGAIIRAGDLVIDGSVAGQLEKLTTALAR